MFPYSYPVFASENNANCNFEIYEGRLYRINSVEKNLIAAEQGREAQDLAEKNLDTMGCKRLFQYRGVLQPVDSFQKRDGEKLRPILMGSVSHESQSIDAVQYLNTYQKNRTRVQNAAYISTTGIVLLLLSVFIGDELEAQGKTTLNNIFFYGGAGLAASGIGYSVWVLSYNENNLVEAVNSFNNKNPNDKIQLKFNAGFVF